MRRVAAVIGLQVYALLLAGFQLLTGVRTDEAKYLLDIPYPHPPLVRLVLGLTDGWAFQEPFWRIVFATLIIQGVWIVWHLGRDLDRSRRMVLAGFWLLSAAVILQAGTVMMAVLTAIQGLVLLWLWDRCSDNHDRDLHTRDCARMGALDCAQMGALVGVLWLVSLFTAYQAVLFLPLVAGTCWRSTRSWRDLLVYVGFPLLLLALYSLGNPLALAAMLIKGEQGGGSIVEKVRQFGWLWVVSGSGVLSVLGTYGLLRARRWPVLASFSLFSLYILFSPWPYYAVLLTPFLVYGARFVLGSVDLPKLHLFLILQIAGALWIILSSPPAPRSPAREVLREIDRSAGSGSILMHGSFGHEWQYENRVVSGQWPVAREREMLRYQEELLDQATAVVCLQPCQEVPPGMRPESIQGVAVFVRSR